MTSADLVTRRFVSWHPLNRQNEKTLLMLLPSRPGVYAIRYSNPKTAPDPYNVVYFGRAANQNGLKGRIRQYFHPGRTQPTNHRLLAKFGDCSDFELSYVETCREEAGALEHDLIAAYEARHGELPPWNKRR